MKSSARVGSTSPETANGPAAAPSEKAPPRSSAPGALLVSLAPARHMRSPLKLAQPGQSVESGVQSATHSARLPTISRAPRADAQRLRSPVSVAVPRAVLQSAVPSSGPGSGVPFAPIYHSALLGSRLPELAHASCAWNQVIKAAGATDG